MNNGFNFILLFRFLDFFRINGTPKYLEDFIMKIVQETIDYREQNNIQRKDFMQLLLQLRNTGEVKADGDWNFNTCEYFFDIPIIDHI